MLDERGVPLADEKTMQCGTSNIFIAGDASNKLPLLHEAADQGKIAGDNAGRMDSSEPGLRRTPISVVFSDPQIAMVGPVTASWSTNTATASVLLPGKSRLKIRDAAG